VNEDNEELCKRLHVTILSLLTSGYTGKIFVIDDGSTIKRDCFRHEVTWIRKQVNTGICKAKNTSIRVLLDHEVDVGFLADDDLYFNVGWWRKYLVAIKKTNVPHFSWFKESKESEYDEINGYPVRRCSGLNGCLLTFTPEVIAKVGGFLNSPTKWGFSHVDWTNRIVKVGFAPYYVDVVNSNNYVWLNEYNQKSAVSVEQRRENRKYVREVPKLSKPYLPVVE